MRAKEKCIRVGGRLPKGLCADVEKQFRSEEEEEGRKGRKEKRRRRSVTTQSRLTRTRQ